MKRQNLLLTGVLCACVTLGSFVVATDTVAAEKASAPAKPTNVSQALKLKYPKHKVQVASPSVGKKAVAAYDLYSAEKTGEAIELLKDIKTKDSKFDRAFVDRLLANMMAVMEGKTDESLEYALKAAKPKVLNPPDQAQLLKLIAMLYSQKKEYKEAINYYKQWMKYTGWEDRKTYLAMAQISYPIQQYADIIKYADKAIGLTDPKKKEILPYQLKFYAFYEQKQIKKAISVLETIVKSFPEETKWWVQLGTFYMIDENMPKALATLDVAYRAGYMKKEHELKTLIQNYYNQDIPYRAAVVLEKHLKSGEIKSDIRMLKMLANSWRVAKHFDKAAEAYGEAAKLENDGDLYRRQASMYLVQEQYKQAIAAAQKAIKAGLKKGEGQAYMMIAESYLYQKDLKNAYKYAMRAAEDPKSKKMATSWAGYIKEKAKSRGIKL